MNHYCTDCKRSCIGELSDDPLLPPAIVCEYCGSELEVLDEYEPDWDAMSPH